MVPFVHFQYYSLSSVYEALAYAYVSRSFLYFIVQWIISLLTFRYLFYFDFSLIPTERHCSRFKFLHTDNHFSQQYLLKRLSFLQHIFLVSLSSKKKGSVVCFYVFFLFCWSASQFLCQYQAVFVTMTLQHISKLVIVIPVTFLVLLKIALVSLCLWWFYKNFRKLWKLYQNFRIFFPNPVKNAFGILMRIALNW